MAWPKEVPVLTARDIHKGSLDGPNGTHCLYGWLYKSFGAFSIPTKAFEQLRDDCGTPLLGNFNDSNPKRKVARTWNRAMAKLGYVVGNPEAKAK